MGEKRKELILGSIGANQFLAKRYIARLIFNKIEHALDGLFGTQQAQEIEVYEMGCALCVFKMLLDRLKWSSKRKDFFDRSGRRKTYFVVSRLRDVVPGWETSKAPRHFREGFVSLKKSP